MGMTPTKTLRRFQLAIQPLAGRAVDLPVVASQLLVAMGDAEVLCVKRGMLQDFLNAAQHRRFVAEVVESEPAQTSPSRLFPCYLERCEAAGVPPNGAEWFRVQSRPALEARRAALATPA
jgi:hypothetical protein